MDIWQAKRDMNYEKWAMKSRPKKAAWQYLINTVHIIFHLYLSCSTSRPWRHTPSDFIQFSTTAAEMLTFSFATVYSEFELLLSTFTGHIIERETMLDATASRGRVIGTEEKKEESYQRLWKAKNLYSIKRMSRSHDDPYRFLRLPHSLTSPWTNLKQIYCIATEYKRFEINQSWVSLSPCVAFPLLSDISLLSTIVVAQSEQKKNSNCGVQVHSTVL